MLFSKSIAVFATLAFGAISSLAAPVVDNTAIVARCDACDAQKGVAGILIDVKAAVGVYVEEMSEYFSFLPSRSWMLNNLVRIYQEGELHSRGH